MSFSDMMSSGRGPGVVGMLLALVVLFGFGALYVLVFDERLTGGERTIGAVLVEQKREIDGLAERLASGRRQLGFHRDRVEENRVFEEQREGNRHQARRVADLAARHAVAKEAADATWREFESYRARYRERVRLDAVGERLERLTLADGHVLHDVEIRSADEIGLTLRHGSGLQRVRFRELPQEIRARFDIHEDPPTAVAPLAESRSGEAEGGAAAGPPPQPETRRERLVREIALKERAIREHQAAMRELDTGLRLAVEESAARAAAGRTPEGGNRVAMLRSRKDSREAEVRRLREEIARLRRGF